MKTVKRVRLKQVCDGRIRFAVDRISRPGEVYDAVMPYYRGADREILVEPDARKMAVYGIDVEDIDDFGAVLEEYDHEMSEARTHEEWMTIVMQAVVAVVLVFALGLHLAEPGVVGLLVISTRVPMFVDRYLIWTGPAFFLLVARGYDQLRRRMAWLATLCLAALLILNGAAILAQSTTPIKSDFRGAAAFLREQRRPHDLQQLDAQARHLGLRRERRRHPDLRLA